MPADRDWEGGWFECRHVLRIIFCEVLLMTKLPILVVDDDRDGGAMMAKLISAFGYDAMVAHNGPTALDLAEKRQFGIAIIDYRMPGMNGVELFRQLRTIRPDLAAIFLTGYPTIDVVYPAIEAGILRVLSKPADFQELMPLINEHLNGGQTATVAGGPSAQPAA
jgi:CheY-like chemotaxis protein